MTTNAITLRKLFNIFIGFEMHFEHAHTDNPLVIIENRNKNENGTSIATISNPNAVMMDCLMVFFAGLPMV